MSAILNPLLDEHFPASSGVRIIAEPGRFYSASAFTLVVNVVARRTVKRSQLKEGENTLEVTQSKNPDELVGIELLYHLSIKPFPILNCHKCNETFHLFL